MNDSPAYHNEAWFWATLRQHTNLFGMCRALKLNYTAVYQYAARNYGYSGGKTRLSDNERQQILSLHAAGRSVQQIVKTVGRPDTTVRRVLFGDFGVRIQHQEALERLACWVQQHGQGLADTVVANILRARTDRLSLTLPSADVYRRLFGSVTLAVREARAWLAAGNEVPGLTSPDVLAVPESVAVAEVELHALTGRFPAVGDVQDFPQGLQGRAELGLRFAFLNGFLAGQEPREGSEVVQALQQEVLALQAEVRALRAVPVAGGQDSPSRRRKLLGFVGEVRTVFGYQLTYDQARQLDRQLQLEAVWTHLPGGNPVKVARLGRHVVYGALTLDEQGCWVLTRALSGEMVREHGGLVHGVVS